MGKLASIKDSYRKFKSNILYLPFQYGLRIAFIIVATLIVKLILNSDNTESNGDVSWWTVPLIILAIILLIVGLVWVIMRISGVKTSSTKETGDNQKKTSLKSPSWLSEMPAKTLGFLGRLIALSLFVWLLFWVTGHKNPVAYITGDQTQEVTAPAGNWTNWIEVEEHWRFKLFYDGKIALQVKLRNGREFTVLSEQRDNSGIPLYITDAATGKLLPMVTSDKITDIRIKSVEATPITVKIEHWKEEYPIVQQ